MYKNCRFWTIIGDILILVACKHLSLHILGSPFTIMVQQNSVPCTPCHDLSCRTRRCYISMHMTLKPCEISDLCGEWHDVHIKSHYPYWRRYTQRCPLHNLSLNHDPVSVKCVLDISPALLVWLMSKIFGLNMLPTVKMTSSVARAKMLSETKQSDQSRQTNQSYIRKHSPKTDKLCNVYIMNGWSHEIPKGSEFRCSIKSEHILPHKFHPYRLMKMAIHDWLHKDEIQC